MLAGAAIHDHVKVFRPPFEEFEIQLVEVGGCRPQGARLSPPGGWGPLCSTTPQGMCTCLVFSPWGLQRFKGRQRSCGSADCRCLTLAKLPDRVRRCRPRPTNNTRARTHTTQLQIPADETVPVPVNPGPLLLLVQSGAGSVAGVGPHSDALLQQQLELHRGSVVFVPAGTQLTYTAGAASGAGLKVWVAACNSRVFAPLVAPAEEVVAQPERVLVAA